MTSCATCGDLSYHFAVTGQDESLPASVQNLKRLWTREYTLGHDVLLCPTCGAWFELNHDAAFTGSGNGDSQTLERLAPEVWSPLERLLHGDTANPDTLLTEAFTRLNEALLLRAFECMKIEVFAAWLPALVTRFVAASDPEPLYRVLVLVIDVAVLRTKYLELIRVQPAPLAREAKWLTQLCEEAAAKRR
ncbi:MAG: hypothetical protein Q8L14_08125 [Myxococcales bacterium]|nr:hypothetical protein [Myxococcales bacterium]